MKKIIALLIAICLMAFALTGCDNVKPVSNVGGEVKSGNGTFAVEKGDYVYFVNGIGNSTASNKMGEVEKGALVRVKTSDIGTKNANVELVIPKLMNTGSAINGLFIFGDVVYYATPYDGKDKTSTVRSDYTDFRSFDLKTAKSKRLFFESKTVKNYQFIQKGNEVYAIYECSETVDGKEVTTFKVYNLKGDLVYSVDSYLSLATASNSDKVFFNKVGYSEELEQDENFNEIYSYVVGDSEAKLVYSGCGKNAIMRDGREEEEYDSKRIKDYTDLSGLTFEIVKNTGSLLVFKAMTIGDVNTATHYFGVDLSKDLTVANLIYIGRANDFLNVALTNKSHFVALNEIYYVESSDKTSLKGLVKFDYTKANDDDKKFGRTLISSQASSYSIAFIENGFAYLCGQAGDYYRVKLDGSQEEPFKINAIKSKSITEWFIPRVINDKFISVLGEEIFSTYLYAVDMANIGSDEYKENYLEKYAEFDRVNLLEIKDSILGKMTESDKEAFKTKLDKDYPEEE